MPTPPVPPTPPKYQPPTLDTIETPSTYTPGGYHPLDIDDLINSRYKIIHKLGYGGFSTVWLARDRIAGLYVALKIGIAGLGIDIHGHGNELKILRELKVSNSNHPGKNHIIPLLDHFTIEGPNGQHLCLVLQVAGPSLASLNYTPGAVGGSRRLRAELAVKIAKQVVQALEFIHSRGLCHGDLTASNILFKLNDSIDTWSEEEVYKRLGHPIKDKIKTISGSTPGKSAPKYLVQPCSLLNSEFLSEEILLVDFGCAFPTENPPSDPDDIGLTMSYAAPEVIFDSKISVYSDIWALGCVLFEIRSGGQLFGDWIGTKDDIIRQMVQTFGKLPEPWWKTWEKRSMFFDEDGEPKKTWDNGIVRACKFELDEMIADIGAENEEEDDPDRNCAVMLEPNGVKVPEEEASQMKDLLERILKWKPEERISVKEIMDHRWLL